MIAVREVLASRRGRVVAALLTVLAVVGVSLLVHQRLTALPEDAVLRYGDQVVTEAELGEHVDALNALYGISRPEESDALDEFNRDVAKSVAVSLVLDRAAEDEDIVISEKSARDTLASMLETQLGPDPQQAFQQLLTRFGVSEDDILREVSRQQAIARLFRAVTQETLDAITPADARHRYEEDPAAFAVPETRRIANIVVATRKEAQSLLSSLRRGASFAALARRHSLDDATREKGGVLGTVAAADLEKGYAEAAFSRSRGDTFGPLETSHGWNVGIVQEVVPGRRPSYEAVSAEALDLVRSERAMEIWREWLADRIVEADIEYAADYLPEHPDEPPVEATPVEEAPR